MSLQNLLAFLLTNWQNVIGWFTQWIGGAINLLTNFWTYLQQKKTEAVAEASNHTTTVVAGAVSLLQLVIKAGNDLIHGRISQVVIDLLLGIQVAKVTLEAGIELAKQEGNTKLQDALTTVHSVINGVYAGLKGFIDALGLNILQRIDQLSFEFRQIIHVSGLSLAQKRELLKLFLDDPLGFIASVFFEIAIPILMYEIARGISEANVDVGAPPVISSDINKVKILSEMHTTPTD